MNIQEVCKKLKENESYMQSNDWQIEISFKKYSFPIWLDTDKPKHDSEGMTFLRYLFDAKAWNSERVEACPNKFKLTVEKWED